MDAGNGAARDHHFGLKGFAFVAARKNRRVPAGFAQAGREVCHHGRLPYPAHGETADADDGRMQGVLSGVTESHVHAMTGAPDPR